jgi:ParB family chromosome partitioning protein
MTARNDPPRLGRGLAALLGDLGPAAPPAAVVSLLPIAHLVPSPFQPRQEAGLEEEAIEELARSIAAHGILQPLLVRRDPAQSETYQIIAGERRWRAAQRAGLHEVPAIIRNVSDEEALIVAMIENLQRRDLDPIEEAEGYRRLLDEFALTQEALAEAVGKSRSHITNMLRLLKLPPEVRKALRAGTLSFGHARALLAHPDPARAAQEVLRRGLNVRATEDFVRRSAAAPSRERPTALPDPDLAALTRDLSARLGLRVSLRFDGQRGSLRIDFQTLDQLEGLIALLAPDGRS